MTKNSSALEAFFNKFGQPVTKDRANVLSILRKDCPSDEFSSAIWGLSPELFEKKLEFAVPPGCRVLDLGCGTGVWSVAAASTAREVVAIDLSHERISLFKKILLELQLDNVKTFDCSVFSLHEEDESFDAVVCYNVLQLVENYDDILLEIFKLLKPGGILYCSVADIGVVAYYAWQAFFQMSISTPYEISKLISKSYLRKIFSREISSNNFNGVYLRDKYFVRAARLAGFDTIDLTGEVKHDIYPKRFGGMPFFNEYLFQKPKELLASDM